MTPPAYTRRLVAAANSIPGDWETIYTAPETYTTILRDVFIGNQFEDPQRVFLSVLSGGLRFPLFGSAALPTNETIHLEMRQELLAGDVLQIFGDVAGYVTVMATGYLFKE